MKRLAIIALFLMVTPALAQQQQPQASPSQLAVQIIPIISNWAAAAEALPIVQKQLADAQKQITDLQKELDALKPKGAPK